MKRSEFLFLSCMYLLLMWFTLWTGIGIIVIPVLWAIAVGFNIDKEVKYDIVEFGFS